MKSPLLLLIIAIVLVILAEESQGKSGKKSRIGKAKKEVEKFLQNRNSRKRTSISPSRRRSRKSGKYLLVGGAVVLSATALNSQRYYHQKRRIPTSYSSYTHYNSSEIPSTFAVGNNDFWTAFLLAPADDLLLRCLVVPANITKEQCPLTFAQHVTNETRFNLTWEYNATSERAIRPVDEIALCCGSVTIRACFFVMSLLLAVTILHTICFA